MVSLIKNHYDSVVPFGQGMSKQSLKAVTPGGASKRYKKVWLEHEDVTLLKQLHSKNYINSKGKASKAEVLRGVSKELQAQNIHWSGAQCASRYKKLLEQQRKKETHW